MTAAAARAIARQSRDNNCLAAMFDSRHVDDSKNQKNFRARKNKIGTSPPPKPPKNTPPLKRGLVWAWSFFLLQKEAKEFPAAHKIGAAISGPRTEIAGEELCRHEVFFWNKVVGFYLVGPPKPEIISSRHGKWLEVTLRGRPASDSNVAQVTRKWPKRCPTTPFSEKLIPLSNAGKSMTSSERPLRNHFWKKRRPQLHWGGENSGNALEASNALNCRFGGSQPYSQGEFQETLWERFRRLSGIFRNFFRNVPAVLFNHFHVILVLTPPFCVTFESCIKEPSVHNSVQFLVLSAGH